MLKLPGHMDPEQFLGRHWQKEPLFIDRAVEQLVPALTRNELAWLATLDDVESRLILTDRSASPVRYRTESGPFDPEYLAALPRRDWTLLVHDVEKHLPALRALFQLVPFIPDWRIDDLMVSFAAPGGGVGPHSDNYDVFLCQGIGTREWHVSMAEIAADSDASEDLALLRPFAGEHYLARQGDILYLPPGVAHWGTAKRACLTYSIGMRAPLLSDLGCETQSALQKDAFYADPELAPDEAQPGLIGRQAIARALRQLDRPVGDLARVGELLGRCVTATKEWLSPEGIPEHEARALCGQAPGKVAYPVHGMARVAFDESNAYVNGRSHPLPEGGMDLMADLCRERRLDLGTLGSQERAKFATWLLRSGALEIPGSS
jgi:50S ribosomal protein L16 3-hydroxylase